jgi:lysyl-tRNA synthetase class II
MLPIRAEGKCHHNTLNFSAKAIEGKNNLHRVRLHRVIEWRIITQRQGTISFRGFIMREKIRQSRIKTILTSTTAVENLRVRGWVRTIRSGKGVTFIALNDGSCLANLQIVLEPEVSGYEEVVGVGTGASLEVEGPLAPSPAAGQQWELHARQVRVLGGADPDYPLQKKRHTFEYLRTIAHLRPRSNTFGAVFRMRSALSFAIHQFFQERGFLHVHTPSMPPMRPPIIMPNGPRARALVKSARGRPHSSMSLGTAFGSSWLSTPSRMIVRAVPNMSSFW